MEKTCMYRFAYDIAYREKKEAPAGRSVMAREPAWFLMLFLIGKLFKMENISLSHTI